MSSHLGESHWRRNYGGSVFRRRYVVKGCGHHIGRVGYLKLMSAPVGASWPSVRETSLCKAVLIRVVGVVV